MRSPDTKNSAEYLSDDVNGQHRRCQVTSERKSDAHGRIEMCAGDRAERQNENGENGARWQSIAQKRKRIVTTCELLRHNTRADHGGEQESRAKAFRNGTLCTRRH